VWGFVYPAATWWVKVKVRISKTPDIDELDGVRLDDMTPGAVREVSSSIGSWLIAERYAEPEMRNSRRVYEDDFLVGRDTASDRPSGPRRRSSDR
jgi:hypothetical protein